VWGIKGENDKWYGTMVGIKGLRKKAREQADKEGGTFWTELRRVEPKMYNLPDTAVVYETHLRDTTTMQAYGKSLYTLTQSGIPYAEAIKMIGNAPVYTGVGVATPDERSKMGLHARARKRSEADAIKQRYDISFPGIQFTEGADDIPADAIVPDALDGEFTTEVLDKKPEHTETEIMKALGFDPEFEKQFETAKKTAQVTDERKTETAPLNGSRPYTPEILKLKLIERSTLYTLKSITQKQEGLIAVLIDKAFVGSDDHELRRHAVQMYLFGVESLKDVTPPMLYAALNDWLKPVMDSGGDYNPDAMALKEIGLVYNQAIVDQGQMPLPL